MVQFISRDDTSCGTINFLLGRINPRSKADETMRAIALASVFNKAFNAIDPKVVQATIELIETLRATNYNDNSIDLTPIETLIAEFDRRGDIEAARRECLITLEQQPNNAKA